ncbi:hypothetical protein [Mycobacterium conspicuum]|jgi:hypothetical protein|uniref:Putative lipoprotein LppW n=1 Tax=Mycobacterium conspicuum TaxID=44010 RepID=A0A1X1STG1_9MYCO|nr:hypothetical protein [Mycobacterium conspicuum]ORV34033.1 hypothetical protein AWC00_27165 [Mycobacterium conspicuum]BBZ38472.1 putative lipoprotein LppW [Mycobacterium conspicuum]
MHPRPLALLSAMAVVTLVLAGCDQAILESTALNKAAKPTYSAPGSVQPQPKLADMLLQAGAPPAMAERPPTLGYSGLSGVQARIQQASDQAAAAGANLSVAVLDRFTHQLVSNGDAPIPGIASVAKLFIADDLLAAESAGKTTLSPEDRQAMDIMLQASDDGAAEKFWGQNGGDVIVSQVANRYGLAATTPPGDGRWWNTISTAGDLVRYYEKLLDGAGGLPPERARMIINDLAQSTPNGNDGYPQRFGIPDGLYAEPVAVKQGWMCCIGADWMHLSTGVIGADRRYIMVIESLQPSDDATARATITQAVKTIFPNGRI